MKKNKQYFFILLSLFASQSRATLLGELGELNTLNDFFSTPRDNHSVYMSLPTAKTDVTATTHLGDINLQLQDDSFVQLGINNMYNTAHNMQVGDTFNNTISTNTQNIDTMTVDTDSVFNNENPYIDQYE